MSARTQESQGITQTFHTERQWQKKFFGMGCCCFYCGDSLTLATAHKEHRIPLCRGGSDGIRNIVPACSECNQMKGWRTDKEFVRMRPALYAAKLAHDQQLIGGIDKPKPPTAAEVLYDEPDLLRRLIRERDDHTSWAWRHPA